MGEVTSERELTRADFPVLTAGSTRWADNDMFAHLNNAVYYQLFDSAINRWVITGGGVDVLTAPTLALTAESGCKFFREVGFPHPVEIGLRVQRIGRSSVVYQLGVFAGSAQLLAVDPSVAALGHWVHVYVDRVSRESVEIPTAVRTLLHTALV